VQIEHTTLYLSQCGNVIGEAVTNMRYVLPSVGLKLPIFLPYKTYNFYALVISFEVYSMI